MEQNGYYMIRGLVELLPHIADTYNKWLKQDSSNASKSSDLQKVYGDAITPMVRSSAERHALYREIRALFQKQLSSSTSSEQDIPNSMMQRWVDMLPSWTPELKVTAAAQTQEKTRNFAVKTTPIIEQGERRLREDRRTRRIRELASLNPRESPSVTLTMSVTVLSRHSLSFSTSDTSISRRTKQNFTKVVTSASVSQEAQTPTLSTSNNHIKTGVKNGSSMQISSSSPPTSPIQTVVTRAPSPSEPVPPPNSPLAPLIPKNIETSPTSEAAQSFSLTGTRSIYDHFSIRKSSDLHGIFSYNIYTNSTTTVATMTTASFQNITQFPRSPSQSFFDTLSSPTIDCSRTTFRSVDVSTEK